MKKIIITLSKIWSAIWYTLIPLAFISALQTGGYSLYQIIYYSFIMATIGTIPLVLVKYFTNKKQEKKHAIQ